MKGHAVLQIGRGAPLCPQAANIDAFYQPPTFKIAGIIHFVPAFDFAFSTMEQDMQVAARRLVRGDIFLRHVVFIPRQPPEIRVWPRSRQRGAWTLIGYGGRGT
jgi:hypothetical protein